MNIVQIGSNKGYDDLTNIVQKYNPNEINFILLVEPHLEFNKSLEECYKNYNFVIENVVVNTDENQKKVNFFTCDKSMGLNYSEISSLDKNHIIKHGIRSDQIEMKELDCFTLNNLLKKYNLNKIDILFLDVESMDAQLIKSIDFTNIEINKIYYENLHVDNADLINFFSSKGYIVISNVLTNGWSNEAQKL